MPAPRRRLRGGRCWVPAGRAPGPDRPHTGPGRRAGCGPGVQLRFPALFGTAEAFAGQPGRPRSVTEAVRRPGRPQQHPGPDVGGGGAPGAQSQAQEPAALAVAAGCDPPSGEPGGQFPSHFGLVAAERPRQSGAQVGLLRQKRRPKLSTSRPWPKSSAAPNATGQSASSLTDPAPGLSEWRAADVTAPSRTASTRRAPACFILAPGDQRLPAQIGEHE
jgi:hypothetical protein